MVEQHLDDLCAVGLDPELWRWTTVHIRTRDDMSRYVATALRLREEGSALPFVTIWKETGAIVGSTRFGAIDREHRRVEIGWTWIARQWQRTPVNTEAKLLMLTHALEALDFLRVEFKTDALNAQSRAALLRIGAREEGTLRSHMVVPAWVDPDSTNGQPASTRSRDSVFFSIVRQEWPAVKHALAWRLGRTVGAQPGS
jgi:RimJ/RimL family protein N-acetyltransferase